MQPLENRLTTEYTTACRALGMSNKEASEMAQSILAEAKQEVVRRGWNTQPTNLGNHFLQREASDPGTHAALEKLSNQGVRNEDIRWWWNMAPLERVMIEKVDERNRGAAYIAFRRQGLEPQQAAQRLWRIHPQFGDFKEGAGEDGPLPIELKGRITVFIERHYSRPDVMEKMTDQYSSFNALTRSKIRSGEI
jgi:hypothetical protein